MRKIFVIFSVLLVTVLPVSCDKITTNISQREKPGEDDPRTPGTQEESGETIAMDAIAIDYYGEYYAAGVHNFVVTMSSGTYDSTGDYFVDKGVEVVVDINLSQANLRGCTLKCSEDETASNCFLAGYVDEEEATFPTYVYVQRSITDESLDCDLDYVTSGTVSLTPNGVNISVYADLTTSGGKNYKVSYSGPFTVTDQSEGEGGDEGGEGGAEGETAVLDNVVVEYYGEYYTPGAHNYLIKMYSGTYDEDGVYFLDRGREVAVELNLSQPAFTSCTLNCSDDENAAPCFLSGFLSEDGSVYPTYVYVQRSITDSSVDFDLDYVTSGTFTITPDGSSFSLAADFTTSAGVRYRYSYSGPYTVVDCTDEEGGDEGGDEGDYSDITVADYKKLPAGDQTYYYMTGIISDTYHNEWGNFYLSDDTGKINIYGLLDTDGTKKVAYQKYGLADGDYICILVNKAMWDSTHNDIVDPFYVDSMSSGGGSEDGPEGDYEMKGINQVYAYNLGADYNVSTTGYDDWEIYMYNDNDDEFLCVNVFTAGGSGENLAPGTYTVKALESEADFHAGVCVAAYDNGDGYVYGTYYGYGEYAWYWAETGTVTISKSGDNYTINVAFNDSVEDADFKCSYTGPVTCYDVSSIEETSTKAASGSCKKGARSHRSVFRHAAVKAPWTVRSASSVRHASSGRMSSHSSTSARVFGRACVRGASLRHHGKTVR